MVKTITIAYENQDQIFLKIVEQLKKTGNYHPNFLFRTLLSKNIPILKKTGNDRDNIDPNKIEDTVEVMDEFQLQSSDFIYASTEEECKEGLEYGIGGDCALARLNESIEPVAVAIYNPSMFRALTHNGYEFLDKTKKGKLEALLGLFKIKETLRVA